MKRVLQHLVASSVAAVVAAAVLAQDPAPAPIVPPPITPLPAGSGVEPLPPDAEPPAPEPAPKPAKGKPAPPPPVIRPPGEEGKASTPLPPKAIEVPAAVQKEGDRPSRFYLQTGAGVLIVPDLKTSPFNARDIGGAVEEIGMSSATLETDVGVSWSLMLGLKLTETASIEIESGYATASISDWTGQVTEFIATGTADLSGSFPGGGDGTLSMIPIFVNVAYDVPIVERRPGRNESGLGLRLAGGFGVTQMDVDVQSGLISAPAVPAPPEFTSINGQSFSIDGTSWQIAGQFRADVLWQLSSNFELGISWRIMYMDAPAFGSTTFTNSDLEFAEDVKFDATWAQSIQASLTFQF
jgi:hypothetical protein